MSRPRWPWAIVVGFALACALPIAPAPASVMPGWYERTLVRELPEAPTAAISGDRVAWLATDGDHMQVFTRRMLSDASLVQVTRDDVDHENLLVSGDRLVWTASDGHARQIFTQLIGSDTAPVQLTHSADDCSSLAISGSRLVWMQGAGAASAVYEQNLCLDASPTQVSASDSANNESPVVAGDRVAWVGSPSPDGSARAQLFVRSMTDGSTAPQQLASAGAASDPAIGGSTLVWTTRLDGAAFGALNVVDLSTGTAPSTMPGTGEASGADTTDYAASGGRIVWWHGDGMYTLDAVAGAAIAVPGMTTSYDLSGDLAVWEDTYGAENATAIYLKNLGSDHAGASAAARFTTDADDDFDPHADAGSIVWTREDLSTGTYSLVLAQQITTPEFDLGSQVAAVQLGLRRGRATRTLSMRIRDAHGPLHGKTVYLQMWSKAGGWRTAYKLTTDASGLAYKTVAFKKAGWTHLRWYAPADGAHRAAASTRQSIHVR